MPKEYRSESFFGPVITLTKDFHQNSLSIDSQGVHCSKALWFRQLIRRLPVISGELLSVRGV